MAEDQFTTGVEVSEGQTSPAEAKEDDNSESFWGDDYTEIIMSLDQIKALGDVLTTAIGDAMRHYEGKGYTPFNLDDKSLISIGHLIQEKTTRIKALVGEVMVL